MTTKKSKPSSAHRLTLHQLIVALSFWGSSVRLLLVAFLVASIFIIRLMYLDTTFAWESQVVIYVLGSFVLLDVGYVLLARALALNHRWDVVCLLAIEVLLAANYVLPNIAHAPALAWFSNWTFLIVILVIAVRGLLGLLFTSPKKR